MTYILLTSILLIRKKQIRDRSHAKRIWGFIFVAKNILGETRFSTNVPFSYWQNIAISVTNARKKFRFPHGWKVINESRFDSDSEIGIKKLPWLKNETGHNFLFRSLNLLSRLWILLIILAQIQSRNIEVRIERTSRRHLTFYC